MLDIPKFNFSIHPLALTLAVTLMILYPIALSHLARRRNLRLGKHAEAKGHNLRNGFSRVSNKKILSFYSGVLFAIVAIGWPLGDLARHYSLLFYLMSNSILALFATPLTLIGLPRWTIAELTKNRHVDKVLRYLTRPVASTIIFTIVLSTTMMPSVVALESESSVAWDGAHLFLVGAAALMWSTGLNLLPGLRKLSSVGRVLFFFLQSLVPTFPAVVLLFAKRPLYPPYFFEHKYLGLSPVTDQQLSGGLVKFITIAVFWSVAGVILARANKDEELGLDNEELTWDDVEREFQRSDARAT